MNQKIVHYLEREVEKAIVEIVVRLGLRELPLLPSQHTMQLMAKAAVAVYTSAVENDGEPPPRTQGTDHP